VAKGSHATRGGWEPKTCAVCGQPVLVSKPPAGGLDFRYDDEQQQAYAWHMACKLPVSEADHWRRR